MSRYIVRVVGPAGREQYLWCGVLMSYPENAQVFKRKGNAWNAAARYLEKHENTAVDVLDADDPEARVTDA